MNELISLVILLILSGFFSGSETALTTISRARAESLLKEGRQGAGALWKLKNHTTRMLIIILIGNNLVNIAASALATVIATRIFGHIGPGIAVGVLTIVILIFGEITPKSWAAHNSERISLIVAPLILAFGRLALPLVWVLERFTKWLHRAANMEKAPSVTEMELISMAEHGAEEGVIESKERDMIERLFMFNDLLVMDVMTPRNVVFSMDGNQTIEDAMPEILGASYSRIPLYECDPEAITRVLYLRDVLQAVTEQHLKAPLKSISHEPVFTPQNQPIDELFATLRSKKRHLAIAVNEYGILQGIVTLEDLLEELVGEIYDESDTTPNQLRETRPGTLTADAGVEMREVRKYFQLEEISGKPTDTIGLWVLNHTQRIPQKGESFAIDGLLVTIEKATKRQIEQVRITLGERQLSERAENSADS